MEFDSSKDRKKIEPQQEKYSEIPIYCSKKSFPPKAFFDLPPPTLGTLAHHTHVYICEWYSSAYH